MPNVCFICKIDLKGVRKNLFCWLAGLNTVGSTADGIIICVIIAMSNID